MFSQVALSGGGGNRTRVPRHFSVGFYVCSLSTVGRPRSCDFAGRVRPAVPDKQAAVQANRS